ncbi:MAG: hypothetical protein OEY14_05720 [Myxococcales bacterium]|nr:hypothetical protein [Myxococcales bacterium]
MVTLSQLDHLVRLTERDVQGAAEQLASYRQDEPGKVARLLGIPVEELAAGSEELVDQIRSARRRSRSSRARQQAAKVTSLARRLEETALAEADNFVLDTGTFLDLVTSAATGTLVFDVEGRNGSIDIRFLRRLARACKGTVIQRLELRGTFLVIHYTAARARGFYRLLLHPGAPNDPVFVVQLGLLPEPPAAVAPRGPSIWEHLLDAVGRAA